MAEPTLCTVSGSVRSVFGTPVPGLVLYVVNLYSPLTHEVNKLFLRERSSIRADRNGDFAFNLVRKSTVGIQFANRPELFFRALVPDAATVDIGDLILPYVVSLAFDIESKSAYVGERFSIPVTATLSNGQEVDASSAAVLESANSLIALQESTGYFLGLTAGSTTIAMTDVDPAKIGLGLDPQGNVIPRLDLPTTTFPSPLSVSVS